MRMYLSPLLVQPPWKVSLLMLQIVQNHYPERLGRAVNFQPPFLFDLFWRAIRPFVDPVTRDKLVGAVCVAV